MARTIIIAYTMRPYSPISLIKCDQRGRVEASGIISMQAVTLLSSELRGCVCGVEEPVRIRFPRRGCGSQPTADEGQCVFALGRSDQAPIRKLNSLSSRGVPAQDLGSTPADSETGAVDDIARACIGKDS